MADGAAERPSVCLASPFPVSAMESGWAITSETNCIKRGGNAAETAAATIDATASAVKAGGESELPERAFLVSLCFFRFDGFRLYGLFGSSGRGSNSMVSCDPSGKVSRASAGGSLSEESEAGGAESDMISRVSINRQETIRPESKRKHQGWKQDPKTKQKS